MKRRKSENKSEREKREENLFGWECQIDHPRFVLAIFFLYLRRRIKEKREENKTRKQNKKTKQEK